jgi:putative endopeptidase
VPHLILCWQGTLHMRKSVQFGAAAIALAVVLAAPVISRTAKSAAAPQFAPYGVDLAGQNKAVLPGDDFYAYVNGSWDARTAIPADKASWGSFNILRDLSDERTRLVLEDVAKTPQAPGSGTEKIAQIYASFMDEAAIEAKGAAPLKPQFDAIAALATPTDLARMFGANNRIGIRSPITFFIRQNPVDNTQYFPSMSQSGLGLPDRDYYLKDDAKFAETRVKYVAHIARMLTLAGRGDADAAAKRIMALETAIATAHWTSAAQRQVEKGVNPIAVADLGKTYPGVDWTAWIDAASLTGNPIVNVQQPSAITAIAKLVETTPLATWKEYLTWATVRRAAPFLSSAFVNEDFAFSGTALTGVPQLKDRWKRGVDVVNGSMGEAVGQIYAARYFPPAAKAQADLLVRNVTAAMDARLQRLAWMAPETKVKARAKLAAFTPKIGYPDKWRDYSALKIVPGDALGNAQRAAEFEYLRNVAKIGKPVDKTEWSMTPQTVNAYANTARNEIVFPAAILQPPFFDPNADPAVNYGGIGAVIGHEISHHFDDQGRKFDPKGNLTDWWTAEDVKRFKVLTDQVVAQYGAYQPLAGLNINGELTLGENMADLAGLNVAYDAYHRSLGGKPAPIINGTTGDQRFFMGWAQVWRNKQRDAALRQQLTSDPHSPAAFRPYVVRNLDAWYTAFNVAPGTKYYLAPNDRVRVW